MVEQYIDRSDTVDSQRPRVIDFMTEQIDMEDLVPGVVFSSNSVIKVDYAGMGQLTRKISVVVSGGMTNIAEFKILAGVMKQCRKVGNHYEVFGFDSVLRQTNKENKSNALLRNPRLEVIDKDAVREAVPFRKGDEYFWGEAHVFRVSADSERGDVNRIVIANGESYIKTSFYILPRGEEDERMEKVNSMINEYSALAAHLNIAHALSMPYRGGTGGLE